MRRWSARSAASLRFIATTLAASFCLAALGGAFAQTHRWGHYLQWETRGAAHAGDQFIVSHGATLIFVDSTTGLQTGASIALGAVPSGAPAIVTRASDDEATRVDAYVLAGGQLHRRQISIHRSGQTVWWQDAAPGGARDLRRASCPEDTLSGAPLLIADNASRVIVGTAHGCGDATSNSVISLDAANILAPLVWRFNSGEYEVGAIRSCIEHEATASVICVSDAPNGIQNTVWAINAANGSLRWAAALGPVSLAPVIASPASGAPERLYVLNEAGRLFAIDPSTGDVAWRHTAPAPNTLDVSTQGLTAGSGDYAGHIWIVHRGVLSAVFDSIGDVTEAWSSNGARFVSSPLFRSDLSKLFVIGADRRLYQFGAAGGVQEGSATIAYGPQSVINGWMLPMPNGDDALVAVTAFGANSAGHDTIVSHCIPLLYGATGACSPEQIAQPAPTPAQPPPAPTIPRCERDGETILVRASVEWCDTGIILPADGSRLVIEAQGRWSNSGAPNLGPEGVMRYVHPGTITSDAFLAALIGKVRTSSFAIGARLDRRNFEAGALLLTMNDVPGTFGDNQGYVEVRVRVTPP